MIAIEIRYLLGAVICRRRIKSRSTGNLRKRKKPFKKEGGMNATFPFDKEEMSVSFPTFAS